VWDNELERTQTHETKRTQHSGGEAGSATHSAATWARHRSFCREPKRFMEPTVPVPVPYLHTDSRHTMPAMQRETGSARQIQAWSLLSYLHQSTTTSLSPRLIGAIRVHTAVASLEFETLGYRPQPIADDSIQIVFCHPITMAIEGPSPGRLQWRCIGNDDQCYDVINRRAWEDSITKMSLLP
jgi:hypothetical protein